MDFELTEDQLPLLSAVREFAHAGRRGNSFEGWWNSGNDRNLAQNIWNGTRQ